MLLELTVAEQRFNAVMEVLRDGLTVIEVAGRYSVSRQTVMAGCAATGPAGWTPWPTARIGPASAPPDAGRGRGSAAQPQRLAFGSLLSERDC